VEVALHTKLTFADSIMHACKNKRIIKIEIVWAKLYALPLSKHEGLMPDCLTSSFSQCVLSMACAAYCAEYLGVCTSRLTQALVTPRC